jgi:signal peptidase II
LNVLYITLAVVVLDQITKIAVKGIAIPFLGITISGMEYGQSYNVFGDFFKVTFVENPGMAFGIDVSDTSKLLLSLFSLVASIGIIIYMFKVRNESFPVRLSLALILAGAIGNLIDRTFYGIIYDYAPIFYGRVVDFFNVDFFDFTLFNHTYERWPIFNIADASVSIGVVMLLILHREKKTDTEITPDPVLAEVAEGTNISQTAIENPELNSQTSKDNVEDNN